MKNIYYGNITVVIIQKKRNNNLDLKKNVFKKIIYLNLYLIILYACLNKYFSNRKNIDCMSNYLKYLMIEFILFTVYKKQNLFKWKIVLFNTIL